MTAIVIVAVVCDKCGRKSNTNRHTVTGARGNVERRGWRVSKLNNDMHVKKSNDPGRRDECPDCRTLANDLAASNAADPLPTPIWR